MAKKAKRKNGKSGKEPQKEKESADPRWVAIFERIDQAREAKKLDRKAFTTAIGRHPSSYSKLPHGEGVPSIAETEAIAEVLGVEILWLITGQGPINPSADLEGDAKLIEEIVMKAQVIGLETASTAINLFYQNAIAKK